MRYAIHFTPSPSEPLTHAAAAWLGRDSYSGISMDPPSGIDLCLQDLSYFTAAPRRFGFHANLKAPFTLRSNLQESDLLRELMIFASKLQPVDLPRLEVGKLGVHYGLYLSQSSAEVAHLAGQIVQHFAPMSEPVNDDRMAGIAVDGLSASQLTNLYRWGDPFAMDEFRFQMALTGAVDSALCPAVDRSIRKHFSCVLDEPVRLANLALFVEEEAGAPFRVHSLHPMGCVMKNRRRTKERKKSLAE